MKFIRKWYREDLILWETKYIFFFFIPIYKYSLFQKKNRYTIFLKKGWFKFKIKYIKQAFVTEINWTEEEMNSNLFKIR